MKKLAFMVFAMIICFPLFSQIEFSPEKFGSPLEGYIIKPDGKKASGSFFYAHPVNLSKEVMFNGKIYKPDDLKEFYVNDIKWIPVTAMREKQFAPVSIDGPITTYWAMSLPEGVEYISDDAEWEKTEYLRRLDGDPTAAGMMLIGFKKKMSAFVIDYPELAKKIEKKEKGYGAFGQIAIIEEYNAWYIEQHPEYMVAIEEAKAFSESGPEIPESSVVLPEGLYGKWDQGDYTFTIGKNSIEFNFVSVGVQTANIIYGIDEYDEEMGFISGIVYAYNSLGYDVMETYQGYVGFVSFAELTGDTVKMSFQGHGVVSRESKNAVKADPADVKSMGRVYSRVE